MSTLTKQQQRKYGIANKSVTIYTANQIFKELNRRQNNCETGVIASPANVPNPVHKIFDNLDSTRGRSSTQIRRYIFGKNMVLEHQIAGAASTQIAQQISDELQNKKDAKIDFQAYKPKSRTKQMDAKLFAKLYNRIKQTKQLEEFQKKERKQLLVNRHRKESSYKPMYRMTPQSLRFLETKRFWERFSAIKPQPSAVVRTSINPTTINKAISVRKGSISVELGLQPSTPQMNKMVRSTFDIPNEENEQQRDVSFFKAFREVETRFPKEANQIKTSRYVRAKSSMSSRKLFSQGDSRRRTHSRSSKIKHPVSEIYEQVSGAIMKHQRLNNLDNLLSEMKPFGEIQNLEI